MKTLIYQQVHLMTPEAACLFAVSHELVRRLNPGVDILIIDNASHFPPQAYCHSMKIYRFDEALGHFFHDQHNATKPQDGPGRGMMRGLDLAMEWEYDRVAYVEADCLCAKPVNWGFNRMLKPVACCPRIPKYGCLDYQVWWIKDLKWLKDFDFVGKYDWPNRVGDIGGEPIGEVLYEQILGEHMESLPLRGGRGDPIGLTERNIHEQFPDGIDYVTHVSKETFQEFLRMNDQADLVDWL